ncbi:hypothetical protein Hsw_0107 [Sporocytophaga myxococcoides]|uniref:Uncharacterized protein n=1 Tax=Sporocytophaga myxococcoides TaxID=153721 RepID=A0A098LK68_9BACT|nr:hypothetical protein [Sporocytophaga myxococcoides]GAL86588.1 hypothetical protein Hsw_0107 [Sporocytophaga myxococcoides]
MLYNNFLSGQNLPQIEHYIKLAIPFGILYLYAIYHPIAIGESIELMDASFYLLLVFAIFSKSNIFRGVALSICLLSRFSLIFWTPLYLWIIFLTEDKKNVFKIVGVMASMGMIFYILPFLAKDPTILTNSFEYYKIGILGEWKGQGWQQPGEKPFSIFQGLGFASFFYDFVGGDLSQKISKLQYAQLIFCISSLALAGYLFIKNRSHINVQFFSVLALKFNLIFFYAFVQVPYPYLFFIPVYISIYIISYFAWNIKKTQI